EEAFVKAKLAEERNERAQRVARRGALCRSRAAVAARSARRKGVREAVRELRVRRAVSPSDPGSERFDLAKIFLRPRVRERFAVLEHFHQKCRARLGLVRLADDDPTERKKRLRAPNRIAHGAPRLVHLGCFFERRSPLARARLRELVGVKRTRKLAV